MKFKLKGKNLTCLSLGTIASIGVLPFVVSCVDLSQDSKTNSFLASEEQIKKINALVIDGSQYSLLKTTYPKLLNSNNFSIDPNNGITSFVVELKEDLNSRILEGSVGLNIVENASQQTAQIILHFKKYKTDAEDLFKIDISTFGNALINIPNSSADMINEVKTFFSDPINKSETKIIVEKLVVISRNILNASY